MGQLFVLHCTSVYCLHWHSHTKSTFFCLDKSWHKLSSDDELHTWQKTKTMLILSKFFIRCPGKQAVWLWCWRVARKSLKLANNQHGTEDVKGHVTGTQLRTLMFHLAGYSLSVTYSIAPYCQNDVHTSKAPEQVLNIKNTGILQTAPQHLGI